MSAPRKRRWHRFAIPLALVLTVITGSIIVHELSEPDYAEKHYLSPTVPGGTSGDDLASRLRSKGIEVRRETKSLDAIGAAAVASGNTTLFIPAPEFVRAERLRTLRGLPRGTRVVLVEPGAGQLNAALPQLGVAHKRWATALTSPGADCRLSDAQRVAATRTQYGLWQDATATAEYCYAQGLAALSVQGVQFVVAGSPDPFRADRISEHDNAEYAVDLLSTKPTVIWLDLHAVEPEPARTPPRIDFEDPPDEYTPPNEGDGRPGPQTTQSRGPGQHAPGGSQGRGQGEASGSEPESPFPPWLFPLAAMLLLTALALAVARGRRLGPPVTEPLPIEVKGAETAIGRGNLYRRARARGPALETLRFEARRKMAKALGLPLKAEREQILEALAQHLDEDRATEILYGPDPDNDRELQERTTELLRLVEQVTRGKKENPRD